MSASITLNWASVTGSVGYNVYRTLNPYGAWEYIVTVTAPTYVDTAVVTGTTYYYQITSYSAEGETLASPVASATPVSVVTEVEAMPLNQAIYESGRDVVYAVRGGFVYKLDPNDGHVLLRKRFLTPDLEETNVVYCATTDSLYATYWRSIDCNDDQTQTGKLLVKINPDTLEVESTYDFSDYDVSYGYATELSTEGPRGMIEVGGRIYILWFVGDRYDASMQIFTFDVLTGELNVDSVYGDSPYDDENAPPTGLSSFCHDTDNDLLIMASDYYGAYVYDREPPDYSIDVIGQNAGDVFLGLCYRSNFIYVTVANSYSSLTSDHVYKYRSDGSSVGPEADIDLTVSCTPHRIAYDPVTDRVYVPTWDDAVVIINPNTDTVETVLAGFDSPFDMVFTPSKVWAVQRGFRGLREVVFESPAAAPVLTLSSLACETVNLSWTAVSGATSYIVQRSYDGVTWVTRETTAGTSASYDNPPRLTYFRVRAKTPTVYSAVSATQMVTPAECSPVLLAYYTMDEASGSNRVDSKNGIDLILHGSVPQDSGLIGSAIKPAVNSVVPYYDPANSLQASSALFLPPLGAFTWCFWYKKTGSSSFGVSIRMNGGRVLSFDPQFPQARFFDRKNSLYATGSAAPVIGTWYFFRIWLDWDGKLHIQRNLGTVWTATNEDLNFDLNKYAFPSGKLIFAGRDGGSAVDVFDEFAFYKGVLSDADAAVLYNAGAGTTYPTVPYP